MEVSLTEEEILKELKKDALFSTTSFRKREKEIIQVLNVPGPSIMVVILNKYPSIPQTRKIQSDNKSNPSFMTQRIQIEIGNINTPGCKLKCPIKNKNTINFDAEEPTITKGDKIMISFIGDDNINILKTLNTNDIVEIRGITVNATDQSKKKNKTPTPKINENTKKKKMNIIKTPLIEKTKYK